MLYGTIVCVNTVYLVFPVLLSFCIIIGHLFDLVSLLDHFYMIVSVKDIPVIDGGDGLFPGVQLGDNFYIQHPWFVDHQLPNEL